MDRERSKNTKKKKSTSLGIKILIVILSMILLFTLVLAVGLFYVMGRVGRIKPVETIPPEDQIFEIDDTEPDETLENAGPEISAEDVDWVDVQKLYNKDIVNILLIGQDRREGEDRARSDSMILVSLNTKKKTIQLTSFMRDLYVQIPGGYADNRINAAYSMGGAKLLDDTLEKNFGIQVDGNVEVDFEQFEAIVDILGGVDVEMNSEESNRMNVRFGEYGTTTPGMNHLNGAQALSFARIRHLTGSDFGRTERQRRLLTAMADSLESADFIQIKKLIDQVLPFVSTDLSNTQLLSLVTSGYDALSSDEEIQTGRIPGDDAYYDATINGMMVLVPYLDRCQEYLQEFIYAD